MRSWVVKGSIDGDGWTVIDRRNDNQDLSGGDWKTASFTVAHPAEYRFILLTQTSEDHGRSESLCLSGVEFFGTLFENLSARVSGISAVENKLEMAALKLRIPMNRNRPMDGIMSYLARKHRGNVHEKGIVTITSKSTAGSQYSAAYAHDYSGNRRFMSRNEPGQWICWDFREMRICMTHYRIHAHCLKTWIVECSMDGDSWTEIDRRTDIQNYKGGWAVVSFQVSNVVECRFIRLTQTDKNYQGHDSLLCVLEFFGTLSE
jgi:hypothetical protein